MPRRPDTPCSGCGKLCWPAKKAGDPSYKPTAPHLCQPCRRAKPTYRVRNKLADGVMDTWRCDGCNATCERPATKGQRPKWCEPCRVMRANRCIRVTPTVRRSIYSRDGWTCGICLESVDESLIGSRSVWRPSLDHIIPRSQGGPDDPTNLRLAHWWCNSVLNDRRAYSEEDFRATA